MKARQYEVWIADLNPRIGTEPVKVRPVVVVQTDLLSRHHPSTVICPITTKVQPDSEILRVHLAKGSCGLDEDCDIKIDQVTAIDNARLLNKVGKVPAESANKIKFNLSVIFDL
jgi:mRNA interferase MazF